MERARRPPGKPSDTADVMTSSARPPRAQAVSVVMYDPLAFLPFSRIIARTGIGLGADPPEFKVARGGVVETKKTRI